MMSQLTQTQEGFDAREMAGVVLTTLEARMYGWWCDMSSSFSISCSLSLSWSFSSSSRSRFGSALQPRCCCWTTGLYEGGMSGSGTACCCGMKTKGLLGFSGNRAMGSKVLDSMRCSFDADSDRSSCNILVLYWRDSSRSRPPTPNRLAIDYVLPSRTSINRVARVSQYRCQFICECVFN